MRRLVIVLSFFLFGMPFVASAGSQSYTSPGTYTFTVPTYGTLTVYVSGAGGGGGGGGCYSQYSQPNNQTGGTGGYSAFGGVVGYGGGGGAGSRYGAGYGAAGSPGTATGGDSNYTGSGAGGGAGGGWQCPPRGGGQTPGTGGTGGAGGYAVKTFASGALSQGAGVTVVVGGGGAGGAVSNEVSMWGPVGLAGNPGSSGSVSISWTSAPATPSCSVTISPNPSPYSSSGTPVTLSWTSTNSTQVYIKNIGWVSPSGSTQVASQATTDYSCYGYSAGYGNGPWSSSTLTVNSPSAPTGTIAASSTTIYTGQSTYITADYKAGSGDFLTADNIDSPIGTGLGADTNPTASKTISFSTNTPGTYTFYARATTNYYTTWQTLASVNVTVLQSCTASTQYSCSGQTIMASSTSATCQTTQTPVTTCVSPQFCSPGSSICVSPPPTDTPSGGMSGHLTAKPSLVQPNGLTTVYWNVSNVNNCQVSGSNGTLWSGHISAASDCASKDKGGCTSLPITGQTIYTLSCQALDGSNYTETATVNVLPNFLER